MNKMTNKELPAAMPAKPMRSVQETISRAAQHEKEVREIKVATGFLDKFLSLFSDYSYRTHYNHKRKQRAVSGRSEAEIVGELRAFYATRPRPWRPAGSRQRPVNAVRFRYRRAPEPA